MHRLLERQIRKLLGENALQSRDLQDFFKAIDESYNHFDEDRTLIERSLELSSKELTEINEKTKQSASIISTAFDSIVDGILVVDLNGKIAHFNKKFVKMWYIPEDVVKSRDDNRALEYVLKQLKYPEAFLSKVRELYNKPETSSYDIIEFKDGRLFERYSQPQIIDDQIVGRVWSFHDLTEQKKAEQELSRSEERLRIVSKATNDVVWDWNLTTDELWWNENFKVQFGCNPEEYGNGIDSWANGLHPEDKNRVVQGIHDVIDSGKNFWSEEYRFRRADGSYSYIFDRGYAIYDKNGKPVRMIGAMSDMTQRKQEEAERIELTNRIKLLLESTDEGIFGLDLAGNCIFINKAGARTLYHKPEELLGKNMHEITHYKHNDDTPYPASECPILNSYKTGKGIRVDNEVFWRGDGKAFSVEYSSYPIVDNKVIKGVVISFTDITERRLIELEREQNLTLFKSLIENIQGGVLVESEERTIFALNQKFCEVFSISTSKEKLVGADCSKAAENCKRLVTKPEFFVSRINEIINKRQIVVGEEIQFASGHVFERDYIPIYSSEGKFIAHLWMYRDVTERKKGEETLRSKNDELERFNKFAVGRELRMVELKQKIRELEIRLENVQHPNQEIAIKSGD